MKRVISMLLCLVMCVSVFTCVTPVYALGKVADIFSVSKTEFKEDKITYTISIAPNQKKIIGAVIKAEFDNKVFEVDSESGAVGIADEYGEFTPNVTGYYESGINYDKANVYSFAFANPLGVNIGAEKKKFITITFKAIGKERPVTNIKLYCEQYVTDDGNKTNDINKSDANQLIYSDSVFTLNPAQNSEVASCAEGLKFTWTNAAGAEWYNVYRKTSTGTWSKLAKVAGGTTEYVDKTVESGVEYYYSVESANKHGVREYDKKGIIGMTFGTVSNVQAKLTERGALITWNALKNTEKYTVFRKSADDADWKQIAEVKTNSYEDAPLTSGDEYSYIVKAHHAKGYIAETTGAPAKLCFIANAMIIEYQLNKSDIVINWKSVDGAAKYEVYRKASGEAAYKLVATLTAPGYTDKNVSDGKSYSYQVRSITKDGRGSVLGEDSFDLVKLPVPTEVKATLGGDNITVSWKAVSQAKHYVITRQDNKNGVWFEIATVDAPETKYVDRAVKSGKTYSYAIKTKADGMVTAQSDPSKEVYYLVAPEIENVRNVAKGMEITFSKVTGADSYNIYRRKTDGTFGAAIATIAGDKEAKYVDTTAASGGKYVYGVQSVHGKILSGISASDTVCRLEEPAFTVKNVYQGIQLDWKAVPSAEKYIIYHSISKDMDKMTVLTETKSTSYVYKDGASGRNNYFAVEAVCGESVSTKTQKSVYCFSSPEVDYIESGANQITLRWNPVAGASSYIVLRKEGNAEKWTEIATVKEEKDASYVEFKDTTVKSGKVYTYTVKAYDGEEYSAYNPTGWKEEFLAAPKVSSAKNYYGGIQVKWSKVGGAKKYEVYRKTKSSGWELLVTSTKTSYVDKTVKNGTKYYYAVRAVSDTLTSYKSDAYFDKACKSVMYVIAPTVKVANTTSGVKVSWNKISGADKYVVYRKAGSAKSWTKVGTTTKTAFTDKKAKSGKTYKYMVKAYKSKTASGYKTSGVSIKYLAAPKLAGVTSTKSGVTIKWNKVSGAEGYYVYRVASGKLTKIATVKGSKKVSYLDKKAQKGKTYTYTVKAYYKKYTSSYRTGLKITDKY